MSDDRSASTAADPVRIGLVGLGYIGTTVGGQFHRHPDAVVAAVCDLERDRLASVGDRFAVHEDRRYREYDAMLTEAPLDAVLIGTPHALHYDQVAAALERGLHVYCDKPLATDLADARDLTRRAEAGKPTLMVGYQRHLQTAFRTARERFRDAEPRWVTASVTQPWLERNRNTWRLDPDLSGGGFLYDTGSHLLDGILWTTGLEPESVAASMTFHDDERVDLRAHLDVAFANGATGSVSLYGDAPAVREHVHLWDDDGAVYLEGSGWGPRRIREVDADGGEYTPYVDTRTEETRANAFLEVVREGRDPPATARDALRVTALTEAAYEAARTGGRVPVDPPDDG